MKTTIWIVTVSLPFFNFFIAPNISFADIGLTIACVSLIFHKDKSIFILNSAENKNLIYLLTWILFSSFLLIINTSNDYINPLTFLTSYLRFFLILYFLYKSRFIFRNNYLFNYLFKVWRKVILFVCFLALIEYLLQFFGIYYSYYFEGITTQTSRQLNQSFRISSIFNEPSYLVIYLNFSLLVILEFINQNMINSNFKLRRLIIIIVITTLLAKSLVGIVLMLVLILVYRDLIFGTIGFQKGLLGFFIFSSFTFFAYYSNIDRINSVSEFEDGSANHRLLGAWELSTILYKDDNIIYGVGLGHQKNFLIKKAYSFENHWFMNGVSNNSGINNMFLLILIQTGGVGLFFYLRFIFKTFSRRKSLFFFFFVSGFGWAFTFNPLYWFCISMLNIMINARKKNLIHLH